MKKQRFIKICKDILNNIIITDYNSHSYVCKLLINDKLNALQQETNKNSIKHYEKTIKELFFYNFNIKLKINID